MAHSDPPLDDVETRRLDGNALAGPLLDLFTAEVAAADTTCAYCTATWPLAEHLLYADAPAMVLRCRGCSGVLLRCATEPGRVRFDLSGVQLLVLPRASQPA